MVIGHEPKNNLTGKFIECLVKNRAYWKHFLRHSDNHGRRILLAIWYDGYQCARPHLQLIERETFIEETMRALAPQVNLNKAS